MLKCPHCIRPLDRIFEIQLSSDILYWKEEGCYYWAEGKEEILPRDIKFTSDDMALRAGYEPEYSAITYFCPHCFYRLAEGDVEKLICKWL